MLCICVLFVGFLTSRWCALCGRWGFFTGTTHGSETHPLSYMIQLRPIRPCLASSWRRLAVHQPAGNATGAAHSLHGQCTGSQQTAPGLLSPSLPLLSPPLPLSLSFFPSLPLQNSLQRRFRKLHAGRDCLHIVGWDGLEVRTESVLKSGCRRVCKHAAA